MVRLNLRDHGDSHHLNPGIFHSCRIAEVVGAVQRLQALYADATLDTAPAKGAVIWAGFEFDVPVRFDTDSIQTSVASFQAGDVPNVPVVEVRV